MKIEKKKNSLGEHWQRVRIPKKKEISFHLMERWDWACVCLKQQETLDLRLLLRVYVCLSSGVLWVGHVSTSITHSHTHTGRDLHYRGWIRQKRKSLRKSLPHLAKAPPSQASGSCSAHINLSCVLLCIERPSALFNATFLNPFFPSHFSSIVAFEASLLSQSDSPHSECRDLFICPTTCVQACKFFCLQQFGDSDLFPYVAQSVLDESSSQVVSGGLSTIQWLNMPIKSFSAFTFQSHQGLFCGRTLHPWKV